MTDGGIIIMLSEVTSNSQKVLSHWKNHEASKTPNHRNHIRHEAFIKGNKQLLMFFIKALKGQLITKEKGYKGQPLKPSSHTIKNDTEIALIFLSQINFNMNT